MVNGRRYFLWVIIWGVIFSNSGYTVPSETYLTTTDNQSIRVVHWLATNANPSKPIILILPGMGDFAEHFEDTAAYFSAKGFDVAIMDWRGQGKSSRQTPVKTLCHVNSFSEYLIDLATVLKNLPSHRRIFILAKSMGGHLALRYSQEFGVDPRFVGMVLGAPMIKVKTQGYPWPVARSLAWIANKIGFSQSFVFGYQAFDPKACIFNAKTHGDQARFERGCQLQASNPQVATGGPSFGWLEASFQSMRDLQVPEKVGLVNVPVFIAAADLDHIVDNQAQKDLCARLPQCRLVEYEGAHHSFYDEKPSIRQQFWSDTEAFLMGLCQ